MEGLLEEGRETTDGSFDGSAFVEDLVDGAADGHINLIAKVDQVDALSGIVALSYHVHLHLCGADAVALTDHIPEGAVTAEARVSGDEEIAEIDGLGDISANEMDGAYEVAHLSNSVGDEDRLEVVS